MLIFFFQDNLTRFALSWYIRLNSSKINKWKDLIDTFLKQYKFNFETAPDRTILIAMEKGNQESVWAYAQKWRDKATHVQPPLIEIKIVMLFANTIKSLYYRHLMGNSAQQFYDNVRIAEKIEQAIKMGKIKRPTMGYRTMTKDESEDSSQVGNLSYVVQPGLVIATI
jgi:hypothetical protein